MYVTFTPTPHRHTPCPPHASYLLTSTLFTNFAHSQGEPGSHGPRGMRGERGEAGLPGFDGIVGPSGEKGERGIEGKRGDMGKDGAVGELGVKGEPGAPGLMVSQCYKLFMSEFSLNNCHLIHTFYILHLTFQIHKKKYNIQLQSLYFKPFIY